MAPQHKTENTQNVHKNIVQEQIENAFAKSYVYTTFDLQLGRVLDLGGRIRCDARVVARMRRGQGRNTEQRRVLIERRDIGAQQKGQRFAVLQPVQR